MATLILLVGWGVFATTTTFPNPGDQNSVYGAFQSAQFQWPPFGNPDGYNLAPGSTVDFVFEIAYRPNTYGGCSGYTYANAPNGTIVTGCSQPAPNSNLTSRIGNYLAFNIRYDPKCFVSKPNCQQSYWSWLSGPSGNLTDGQSRGGFFEVVQPGNYTVHISNTTPAVPTGYVNGTLTFSDGFVLFTRPYFLAGVATLVVAIAVAGFSVFSLSQRPSRTSSEYREKPLPKEMSD